MTHSLAKLYKDLSYEYVFRMMVNMQTKILTVVVPTYNMERYLDRCLSSLILDEEKMSDMEVLVVNDGSKDRSSEIAHGYEYRFPHTFHVIDKENGNYGSCINAALHIATGIFIKVLDADDTFASDTLADYLEFLSDPEILNSADLIVSDYCKVDESMAVKETLSFPFGPGHLSMDDFYRGLTSDFQMHAITYRLELLHKLNYMQTEGISYTDQEWCFLPMTKVNNVRYFNKPLYMYLVGREGQTMNYCTVVANIDMEILGCEKMATIFLESGIPEEDAHFMYLKNRLLTRICYIYSLFLCSGLKVAVRNEKQIETFDSFLKNRLPELYEHLSGFSVTSFFNFRLVQIWRKRHSCKSLRFCLYCICRFVKIKTGLIK